MTYTAKMLMSGDLKISEDGKLAGYLVWLDHDMAVNLLNAINGVAMLDMNFDVEIDRDKDEGDYIKIYVDEEFICLITGADVEDCINLGKALIKQIEGE